jgi:hypothetical protein
MARDVRFKFTFKFHTNKSRKKIFVKRGKSVAFVNVSLTYYILKKVRRPFNKISGESPATLVSISDVRKFLYELFPL